MANPHEILSIHDEDHTLWNKYDHEVKRSVANLQIEDYDGTRTNPKAWLQLHTVEYYELESSPGITRERGVHMTLYGKDRTDFINAIKKLKS